MRAVTLGTWLVWAGTTTAQVPLPVDGSATLTTKESAVYYVEGRQTIPARAHVSCQRGTRIVGRGKEPVLVVEGSFSTVGTEQDRVTVENLTIEPAPGFESLRFALTTLADVELATAAERPVDGILQFESAVFGPDSKLDVAMTAGELRALSSRFPASIRILGVPIPTKNKPADNRTKVLAVGASFVDLEVHGVDDLTVRHTHLSGTTMIDDCAEVLLEGARLEGTRAALRHSRPGGLRKSRLSKCDFYLDELILEAPASKTCAVKLDKAWFHGCDDVDAVRARLRDGSDDPDNGAVAKISKLRDEPNGFADRP